MPKELIVSTTSLETKVAIFEDAKVTEVFMETTEHSGAGSLYKGRVMKVLSGMEAAFVDIGLDRDAFLYVSDFLEEYRGYEPWFTEAETSVDEGGWIEGRAGSQVQRLERIESGAGGMGRSRAKVTSSSNDGCEALEYSSALGEGSHLLMDSPYGQGNPTRFRSEQQQILPAKLALWREYEEFQEGRSGKLPLAHVSGTAEILPERLGSIDSFQPERTFRGGSSGRESQQRKKGQRPPPTGSSNGRSRRRRGSSRGGDRILIGDLLQEGQEILVQVAKEPIGRKGARITSHIALPGRYLVFMPTVNHVGVSRKIVSDTERQRLKNVILKLQGDLGKGFIVRTAGENHSESDFRKDMLNLTRLWADIQVKAERLSGPCLVHRETRLITRVIRDYLSEDFRAIRVDNKQEYERVVAFVDTLNPDLAKRVRLYRGATPILEKYGVTAEIEKALKPKVWLKNGGYIVINQTEALVAIDVNTGRYLGKTCSLEETITKTNLDSAREVVRQIRLRNLGGIIIIDFIDMDEPRNRQKVMEVLKLELSKDKSPSKILPFNEFGLVAITRKRVKQSLERKLSQPCGFCGGTGMTRSFRTLSYTIHEEVRKMLPHFGKGAVVLIRCHPELGRALQNQERQVLSEIETMTGMKPMIKTDPLLHIEQFDLVESQASPD